MNELPHAELAVVDERKLTAYLLSDNHPAGRSKAAFFRLFGFQGAHWQALRDSLLSHARTGIVAAVAPTEFGTKYTLVGRLVTPLGRAPNIRSVWFVANDDVVPRLVTAYPEPEDKA